MITSKIHPLTVSVRGNDAESPNRHGLYVVTLLSDNTNSPPVNPPAHCSDRAPWRAAWFQLVARTLSTKFVNLAVCPRQIAAKTSCRHERSEHTVQKKAFTSLSGCTEGRRVVAGYDQRRSADKRSWSCRVDVTAMVDGARMLSRPANPWLCDNRKVKDTMCMGYAATWSLALVPINVVAARSRCSGSLQRPSVNRPCDSSKNEELQLRLELETKFLCFEQEENMQDGVRGMLFGRHVFLRPSALPTGNSRQ